MQAELKAKVSLRVKAAKEHKKVKSFSAERVDTFVITTAFYFYYFIQLLL